MGIYKIYDNGGETIDQYTIVLEPAQRVSYLSAICCSIDPDSPDGFSQFSEVVIGEHLGQEIAFDDLPPSVQTHVLGRIGF